MKKIMILGASILQLPAIIKAKEMGLQVIAVDMDPDAIGFKEKDVICEVISTIDEEGILEAAKRHNIDGIVTICTDLPMRAVARVAKELELPGISQEAAFMCTNKGAMEKFIREVKPDVIWFQGLLMPHKVHNAIRVAEKMGIPTIISPRGEASPDRMALKGYKKYPYAVLCNLLGIYHKENVFFHATSDDEVVGLKKFFKAKQDRIYQIVNIPVTAAENPVCTNKQKNSIRIMFVSRIHEVKNILLAIQIVKKLKYKAIFDIYGPIESKEYWNLCLKEMEHLPVNIQINYCGVLPMDEVGKTFQNYDAFLFPTINENYGHVIAEALANGCPTVLSKGTTPWDDLDGVAGYIADLKNENEFKEKLEKLASLDEEEYSDLRKSTIEYFKCKQDEEGAIAGHAQMFIDVIKKMKEKRIV